jgi:DNA-binding HxlR family transcriptional regulator
VKRYGQHCPLARALDVVGERWNLLIVRELTLGPRRFRDLLDGLPGIPTNLLAARLKELQATGIVGKRALPPPTAVTVYELTEAGHALRPAIRELRAWGARYAPPPSESDSLRPSWLLLSAGGRPTGLPDAHTCELQVDAEHFQLSANESRLIVRGGPAQDPDAVITMSTQTLYRLMAGRATAARNVSIEGNPMVTQAAIESLRGALSGQV